MDKPYASNEEVAAKASFTHIIYEGVQYELCFRGDHVIAYNKEQAVRLARAWGTEAKCVPSRFANSTWNWFCIVPLPEELTVQ